MGSKMDTDSTLPTQLSLEDYTVAWVCETETEMTVLLGALDTVYPPPRNLADDKSNHNNQLSHCRFGSFGGINIVLMTWNPKGSGQSESGSSQDASTSISGILPSLVFLLIYNIQYQMDGLSSTCTSITRPVMIGDVVIGHVHADPENVVPGSSLNILDPFDILTMLARYYRSEDLHCTSPWDATTIGILLTGLANFYWFMFFPLQRWLDELCASILFPSRAESFKNQIDTSCEFSFFALVILSNAVWMPAFVTVDVISRTGESKIVNTTEPDKIE